MNPSPVGKPPPRPATATSRLRWSRPAIHQLQTNQLRRNRTKSSQSAADSLLEGSLQGQCNVQTHRQPTPPLHVCQTLGILITQLKQLFVLL
jgi:hypothetical protein